MFIPEFTALLGSPESLLHACSYSHRFSYAGFYNWIQNAQILGLIHFWIVGIGVNIVFLPMHSLGLAGMPRRIPDFPTAFLGWNGVICAGVILSVMGAAVFLNVLGATNSWPVC